MRRLPGLIVPLALVALVLGACGGDEDGGDGGTDTTATATSTATADGDATASPTDDASDGGDGDGNGAGDASDVDLDALAEQFANATFTATYEVSGSLDGETVDGQWTWYQQGADRLRMDFDYQGQAGTMISTPDALVICADGGCFSMGAGDDAPFPNLGEVLTDQVDDVQTEAVAGEIRDAGTREIAGVEAQCYEFDDSTSQTTGTVCYTDEGVLLFMESETPEGDFQMEATEFSDSVSDEDFEAPFPVMELPTGGGGG